MCYSCFYFSVECILFKFFYFWLLFYASACSFSFLFFLFVCHRCEWLLPACYYHFHYYSNKIYFAGDALDGPVVTSFYVTVKYLREVTPYFRKASIISEVGWELQRGFLSGAPPSPHSPQRADTRYLPLQLCYLVRNYRHPDPGEYTHSILLIYCLYIASVTPIY